MPDRRRAFHLADAVNVSSGGGGDVDASRREHECAARGMLRRPVGLLPTVTQRATEGGDGTQRALFGASGQPVAVANPATAPSGMACAIADRVARGVVVGEVARGVPFGEVLHEQVAPSIGAVVLGASAVASVIADGSDGALADGFPPRHSGRTQAHTYTSYVVNGPVGGLSCVRWARSGARGDHVAEQLLRLLAQRDRSDDVRCGVRAGSD